MKPAKFYVNATGTKWIKAKEKPNPPRPKERPLPNEKLAQFMGKGEANGDYKLAVLLALRNLLAPAECWCKYERARSSGGQRTEPEGMDAVSWSIMGGIFYLTYPSKLSQRTEIIQLVKRALPKEAQAHGLFRWEELPATRHGQVLYVLNRAVHLRKQELGYL